MSRKHSSLELDKIYVIGNGRISDYLFGLGMRPFSSFSGVQAVICTEFAEQRESIPSSFRAVADLSLACTNHNIPLIFVSNDLVFGDGGMFSEGQKKDPQTIRGLEMLAAEAIIRADGHKTIRVQIGQVPVGIFAYLKMYKRMPQTLHLGYDDRLSVHKARELGVYD